MIVSSNLTGSKFRNEQNVRYLERLFFERTGADKASVMYTLKDHTHEGFPSLYLLYIALEDVHEYTFANTYLESWDHWEQLCKCSWFKPFIERWRKELDLKIKSKALAAIRAEAEDAMSKNAFTANKYLLEEGWKKEPASSGKRGRPSKAEIEKAAAQEASTSDRVFQDYKRLSISN